MTSVSLNQFLVLYTWFPLAALVLFLLLIARFYQKFSGERTFFRLFFGPLILFGAAAVRYTSIDRISGDALGDLALALAGIMLTGLCGRLYWLMILQRGRLRERH